MKAAGVGLIGLAAILLTAWSVEWSMPYVVGGVAAFVLCAACASWIDARLRPGTDPSLSPNDPRAGPGRVLFGGLALGVASIVLALGLNAGVVSKLWPNAACPDLEDVHVLAGAEAHEVVVNSVRALKRRTTNEDCLQKLSELEVRALMARSEIALSPAEKLVVLRAARTAGEPLHNEDLTRWVEASLAAEEERQLNMALTAIVERNDAETKLTLPDVLFEFGSAELRPEARQALAEVVVRLATIPGRLSIAGYTDSVGSTRMNLSLSEARAGAVRDLLVAHGVPAARIEVRGMGSMKPIASNETPEGRERNRRVEITWEP
jgi:outer membrane protein OmpA-like peptidoglycan-associated protein